MEIEHRDADGPGNPDSSYGVHVPAVHATWSTLDTSITVLHYFIIIIEIIIYLKIILLYLYHIIAATIVNGRPCELVLRCAMVLNRKKRVH